MAYQDVPLSTQVAAVDSSDRPLVAKSRKIHLLILFLVTEGEGRRSQTLTTLMPKLILVHSRDGWA